MRRPVGKHSNTPSVDLLEAMLAFQGGDDAVFDAIYQAVWGPVYLRASKMGLGHEESQDIAQKVLVRVYLYARKADFDSKERLWSWIYTIAVREIYKYWKHKRPEMVSEEGLELLHSQPTDPIDDPAVLTAKTEVLGDVGECIGRLGEAERLYLLGPLVQNLTFRQAAVIYRLRLGQFKHRYEKALKKVRNCMKAKGYDLE